MAWRPFEDDECYCGVPYRVVVGSLEPGRECARGDPARWPGLTGDECTLLLAWLSLCDEGVEHIWTGVPCGLVPVLEGDGSDDARLRISESVYALRMDCVYCGPGGWGLIEIKRDAGYAALGQVLTYAYYAGRMRSELADARRMVVASAMAEWAKPVYAAYGVEWFVIEGSLESGVAAATLAGRSPVLS